MAVVADILFKMDNKAKVPYIKATIMLRYLKCINKTIVARGRLCVYNVWTRLIAMLLAC